MKRFDVKMALRPRGLLPGVAAACFAVWSTGCALYAPRYSSPLPQAHPVVQPVAAPIPVHTHNALASYYGKGFEGHRTSSGETYDSHRLTAASRTLPLGSVARVTNVDNGKSVVVRVNDRGPFVRGRDIDLSRAAAVRVGLAHKGIGRVRVTRLDSDSADPGEAEPGSGAAPTTRRSDLRRRGTTQGELCEVSSTDNCRQ
ncbi:MAG TPA: septal ring lytic transglycosylase RlpA family protein [Candidatus Binataceae bacterium]|nr:septal ring lytic transglycosylase RlpA family protein [Candidatus Binataceae bacterium]